MDAHRLEAFSDGVLAIIITIMVLELRPPESPELSALVALAPNLLAYLLSFLIVAIYWNNHHHLMKATTRVTASVMWANMHLLFWLSLFPLATAWLGEHGNFASTGPVLAYSTLSLFAAISYTLLSRAIIASGGERLAKSIGGDMKGKVSLFIYLCAIAISPVLPVVALGFIVMTALIWFVPDRRIERMLS